MGKLGKRFFEISRGYEFISDTYKRPHMLGVDIHDKEKPFVVATGDHHSDSGASIISVEELLSDKWNEHITKSGAQNFISQLKAALSAGEEFPQKFIVDLVTNQAIVGV